MSVRRSTLKHPEFHPGESKGTPKIIFWYQRNRIFHGLVMLPEDIPWKRLCISENTIDREQLKGAEFHF
jgi:hypothetical protein